MNRRLWFLLLMMAGSLFTTISLCYFTDRTLFPAVIGQYALLFLLYAGMMATASQDRIVKLLLVFAVLMRLVLLFSLPGLSDDFYRFLWDGNLWANGINAYSALPSQMLQELTAGGEGAFPNRLYPLLNSPEYFSVYPPVNQWIFALSAWLFPGQLWEPVVVMKGFILLAECGSIILLLKLARIFNLPQKQVLWYALSPLIIIELMGNLHFEALMIFFSLLMIWLLIKGRTLSAAVALAFAVAVKLLPIFFLPLLLGTVLISNTKNPKNWRYKKSVLNLLVFISVLLLIGWTMGGFSPYTAIWSSIRLYYESFEFNPGLYLVAKELAYKSGGDRTAATLVMNIALLAGLIMVYARYLLLLMNDRPKGLRYLPLAMLWVMSFYYFTASTVHPWYLASLLAFCSLTSLRFPVVWSALIPLTYIAYSTYPYQENYFLILLEYMIVAGWLTYELARPARLSALVRQ
ncbi:MAG: hypothetical protein WD077_12775 [Bacteroidia bacterium]